MKKLIAFAAAASLAACTQAAPEADTEADAAPAETAAPAEVATLAADGKPSTGTFTITREDGSTFTEVVNADGTYTSTDAEGKVETGTWVQKSPTLYCTTSSDEGAKEVCHTEGVDASGKWTSTDPEGKTGTVVRVEG